MTRKSVLFLTGIAGLLCLVVLLFVKTNSSLADKPNNCQGLPDDNQLRALLILAQTSGGPGAVGGLFNGTRMWGAVVNRNGEICSYITSTADPTQVWPGSQAIAKAKGLHRERIQPR